MTVAQHDDGHATYDNWLPEIKWVPHLAVPARCAAQPPETALSRSKPKFSLAKQAGEHSMRKLLSAAKNRFQSLRDTPCLDGKTWYPYPQNNNLGLLQRDWV